VFGVSASPETILEKCAAIIDAELDDLKKARVNRVLTEDEHRRLALYMRAVASTAKMRKDDTESLSDEELMDKVLGDPVLREAWERQNGGR
jgi:hypothetical protein